MSLTLVTPPSAEPVTLAQQKLHSRILRDDEDSLIEGYLRAARMYAETFQRRQLIRATWRLSLDEFPCGCIRLPLPPLHSVTAVTYVDSNGDAQTLDESAYLFTAGTPGRLAPAYGLSWPTSRCQPDAVNVTFVAGYGLLPTDVPESTRQAIKLLAGNYYENREPGVTGTIVSALPFAVDALLALDRWGGYP